MPDKVPGIGVLDSGVLEDSRSCQEEVQSQGQWEVRSQGQWSVRTEQILEVNTNNVEEMASEAAERFARDELHKNRSSREYWGLLYKKIRF